MVRLFSYKPACGPRDANGTRPLARCTLDLVQSYSSVFRIRSKNKKKKLKRRKGECIQIQKFKQGKGAIKKRACLPLFSQNLSVDLEIRAFIYSIHFPLQVTSSSSTSTSNFKSLLLFLSLGTPFLFEEYLMGFHFFIILY